MISPRIPEYTDVGREAMQTCEKILDFTQITRFLLGYQSSSECYPTQTLKLIHPHITQGIQVYDARPDMRASLTRIMRDLLYDECPRNILCLYVIMSIYKQQAYRLWEGVEVCLGSESANHRALWPPGSRAFRAGDTIIFAKAIIVSHMLSIACCAGTGTS